MRVLRYSIPVDDKAHKFSLHYPPFKVAFTHRIEVVEFWAVELDPEYAKTDFYFKVVGTGHEFPDGSEYIATTDRHKETGLVWHLIRVMGPE